MKKLISIIPKEGTNNYILTILCNGIRVSNISNILSILNLSKIEMLALFEIYHIDLITDGAGEFIINFNGKSSNVSTGIIPYLEYLMK